VFGAGEVGGTDQAAKDAVEVAQRGVAGPLTGTIGHLYQAVARLKSLLDQRATVF
jgi:hypothetical protein